MSAQLPTVKQPFLPTFRSFRTQDPDELERILQQMYNEVSQAVNRRVIGIYDKIQVTTGEDWFDNIEAGNPGPLERRQSYRRVFTLDTFPIGAQNHGISGITAFTDFRVMAQGADGWFYKGPLRS